MALCAPAAAQFRPVPPVDGMKPHAGLGPTVIPRPVKEKAAPPPPPVETIPFDYESLNAIPRDFTILIGDLQIAQVGGARGALFDGARFVPGTPSYMLADKVHSLFGADTPTFLNGIQGHATYPLAVLKHECAKANEVSLRFVLLGGKARAAGIAFGIAPDASYWVAAVRGDSLQLSRVVNGVAKPLSHAGTSVGVKRAHTIDLRLKDRAVTVVLDGRTRIARLVDVPPSGRCGLWSEGDSKVLFDEFVVKRK